MYVHKGGKYRRPCQVPATLYVIYLRWTSWRARTTSEGPETSYVLRVLRYHGCVILRSVITITKLTGSIEWRRTALCNVSTINPTITRLQACAGPVANYLELQGDSGESILSELISVCS